MNDRDGVKISCVRRNHDWRVLSIYNSWCVTLRVNANVCLESIILCEMWSVCVRECMVYKHTVMVRVNSRRFRKIREGEKMNFLTGFLKSVPTSDHRKNSTLLNFVNFYGGYYFNLENYFLVLSDILWLHFVALGCRRCNDLCNKKRCCWRRGYYGRNLDSKIVQTPI